MWPLNLPARTFLRLPGATSTAWAVFDAAWYRATYPNETPDASPDALLAYYLKTGQGLSHSPNMLFDEAWHRRAYPKMEALVQAGQFPSCFDAYCRGGCLGRSPHWLFEEVAYRHRYPDLTEDALDKDGLVNGYDHYLWRGDVESRLAHPLFDPAVYLAQLDPADADTARADGPFRHCLRRLHQREPELKASIYFDPAWYLERYPEVARAIARGTWRWALEHYLCNDSPAAFEPNPWFSESYYLARRPDAAAMVAAGQLRNGFAHFLRHGANELASPSEAIDLASYAALDTVRQDLRQGLATNAFTHWITIGQSRELPPAPPPGKPVTEAGANTLFQRKVHLMSARSSRRPLQFGPTTVPALSVIMVLHNQFALTLMALASLRSNYAGDIELILVDSGSTDETRSLEHHVRGARCLRFESNIGYLRACNAALVFATADAVLYLNNDLELAPGAIAAGLHRLKSDTQIGAVGGMIVRTHGVLQEAGGIVWRDGSTQGYMRDASPLAPEANFVREVDFCSGAFLMARRALLVELKGFDEAFVPASYEDVDLCLRMAAAGYRVVYDPGIVLHHPDSGNAESVRENEQVFVQKHADYLERRPARDEATQLFARTAGSTKRRLLFLEDTIPLRRLGSGFVRSNDLVRIMASMGFEVTVFPLNGSAFDLVAVYADMPDSVEVIHDASLDGLEAFLAQRRNYYDVLWIARTHNLNAVRLALNSGNGSGPPPVVVLDTEAIVSCREAERAALEGRPFDLDAAIRQEFRDAAFCQKIVTVSQAEAAALRDLGLQDVSVIGHMRTLRPTPNSFAQRAGMLFVGAIHRMDSPNYESLCWLVDDVLPLIEHDLGWQTRLTVAGYTDDSVNLNRFRNHSRVTLCGAVADLEPLYNVHRILVAPTRFAAGTPYKIHEAASFGLPVVATELLGQQLGWTDGKELVTASATDPAAFASEAVALQLDTTLWEGVRENALLRLQRDNNREDYIAAVTRVLGSATRGK